MVFDAYDWAKNRIRILVEQIFTIRDDNLKISPGQIWSIKKLLVLDYYVGAFVKIIRNNSNFKNWYYVDTHCGSGLIGFQDKDLKEERFPGSPMLVSLRASEYPFTDYIFADEDPESIHALNTRLIVMRPLVGNREYLPVVSEFANTVQRALALKQFGNAFLIFIDPTGYTEIKWDLMKSLLQIPTADIIFTFMTYSIALNKENATDNDATATSLNEFYGNSNWLVCKDGNALVELYKTQLEQYKKRVYTIPVFQTGERKLYDILIATNSTGGGNVIEYARKIMNVTTTELFRDALKVVTKKTTDLTQFFP